MKPGLIIPYVKCCSLFAAIQPIAYIGGFIQGYCDEAKLLSLKARCRPKLYKNKVRVAAPIEYVYDALHPLSEINDKILLETSVDAKISEKPDTFLLTHAMDGAVFEVQIKKRDPDVALEIVTKQISGEPHGLYDRVLDCYRLRPLPDRRCLVELSSYAHFQEGYTGLGRFLARFILGQSISYSLIRLKIEIEKSVGRQ